ncbi:hypothetical protein F5880DRAFT_1492294, partial [Lentinula raphanica]
MKSCVIYIADYITKTGLKTHVIFDSIKTIFEKSTEIIEGNLSEKEKSRRIITRIINHLSTKLELGSPMISLYLLQNPDHYTSHEFVPFYWKTFVTKARSSWDPHLEDDCGPKVVLTQRKGKLIGLSSTFDYTHRPLVHDSYYLYEWIRQFTRVRKSKQKDDTSSSEINSSTTSHSMPTKNSFKQFMFMDGHPLSESHVPVHRRNPHNVVPNFLGGILPRPDKEDREYYCCTM